MDIHAFGAFHPCLCRMSSHNAYCICTPPDCHERVLFSLLPDKRSWGNVMQKKERLRQRRLERHWRQRDVAEQLNVSLITVQRWERGIQQPSLYYRAKLCALFEMSAQELGLEDLTLPFSLSESSSTEAEPPGETPALGTALWTVPYARNPHFTGRDDLL